jgi:FixJ family two-component response regulator
MLTANDDVDLARDALKLGAFDYVAKPFDFGHLASVIESAVAHRSHEGGLNEAVNEAVLMCTAPAPISCRRDTDG